MKRSVLAMMCMLAISSYAEAAVTINYNTMLDSDGVLTTVYAPTTVYDFSSDPGLVGNYALVTGSLTNKYAAPYNDVLMAGPDTTPYLSVPEPISDGVGSAVLSFGTSYDYFGLFWGSIDSYNTLQFLDIDGNNETVLHSFTGDDIANPANGNQSAPYTNSYVNFLGLDDYNAVRFTSMQFAYEVDNVAVGNVVPVPGSLWLTSLGLAGLGMIRRRRAHSTH